MPVYCRSLKILPHSEGKQEGNEAAQVLADVFNNSTDYILFT